VLVVIINFGNKYTEALMDDIDPRSGFWTFGSVLSSRWLTEYRILSIRYPQVSKVSNKRRHWKIDTSFF